MADKSPSDLQMNALDINSSLEMAVDEENNPMQWRSQDLEIGLNKGGAGAEDSTIV